MIFVSPAVALALKPPDVIYIRYFYVNILFYLVLLAGSLAWLRESQRFGTWMAWGAVAAIVAGNSFQTFALLRNGRGDYEGALRDMAAQSREPVVHIGSDQDFRNDLVLWFYAPRVGGPRPFQYHRRNDWPPGGPEWFILSQGDLSSFPRVMPSPDGRRYELVRLAPASQLTGIGWGVYHKQ